MHRPMHHFVNVIGEGAAAAQRLETARALIRRGRHARAARVLRETAWALSQRGAAGPAVDGLQLLGSLLRRRGQAREAAAAFGDAAAVACSGGLMARGRTLRIWRALALVEDGRVDDGERACSDETSIPEAEAVWPHAVLARCRLARGRIVDVSRLPVEEMGSWAHGADLERTMLVREADASLIIVQNWFTELERLVPTE